jgi:hypothetical protein
MIDGNRLERIRARADAVAPGPWKARDSEESWSLHAGPMQILKAHKSCAMHAEYWPDQVHADFITHARSDIGYLLSVIDYLQHGEPSIHDIELPPEQLRVEIFRSCAPAGSIRPVENIVRLIHLPTGLVAVGQGGKTQMENKRMAMEQLLLMLAEAEENNDRG